LAPSVAHKTENKKKHPKPPTQKSPRESGEGSLGGGGLVRSSPVSRTRHWEGRVSWLSRLGGQRECGAPAKIRRREDGGEDSVWSTGRQVAGRKNVCPFRRGVREGRTAGFGCCRENIRGVGL